MTPRKLRVTFTENGGPSLESNVRGWREALATIRRHRRFPWRGGTIIVRGRFSTAAGVAGRPHQIPAFATRKDPTP